MRKIIFILLILTVGCSKTTGGISKDNAVQTVNENYTNFCGWVSSIGKMNQDSTYDFTFQNIIGGEDHDYRKTHHNLSLRLYGNCGSESSIILEYSKTYSLRQRTDGMDQMTRLSIQLGNASNNLYYTGQGSSFVTDTKPYGYNVEVNKTTSGSAFISNIQIQAENILQFKIYGNVKSACSRKINGADGHQYYDSFDAKDVKYELDVKLTPGGFSTEKGFSIRDLSNSKALDTRHTSATADAMDTTKGLYNTNEPCL